MRADRDGAGRTADRTGREGRDSPPSLSVSVSGLFLLNPASARGEPFGRTGGRAIPISASPERGILPLPPFHSALLHNSNVEGKNGRGGRTRFPRIGFRVVVIEDRRRKSESSVSVV